MSNTGVSTFDTTVQETNIWLRDLMEELDWDSRQNAYAGLRAVLQTLRDHLGVDEGAHLAAQLPMLIRGIYYENFNPSRKLLKERSKEEFLDRVSNHFPSDSQIDPEELTRAVFKVLSKHVNEGEIQHVVHILPQEIRELWPMLQPSHH